MGFERDLSPVLPILFTANGGAQGQIQLSTTLGLFVKQEVILNANTLEPLNVQIKQVLSDTQILVGHPTANIQHRMDVSAYTLAKNANLSAVKQRKSTLPNEERLYASYIQEPSNSWRVTPVDSFGNSIDNTNPLPVSFEGGISIANVGIIGPDPDNNRLDVNTDGSINVNIVSAPITGHLVRSIFNEVLSVPSGFETLIVSYTVPIGSSAILERSDTSGDNVARFNVYLNGSAFDVQRTYFGGEFNAHFEYTTGTSDGFVLNAGDILTVKVLHNRPFVGNFTGRIQVVEIT